MEVKTISLGAGKDTVVFAANAAANGEDEITGFKAGTGTDADVLNFTATGVKKGNPDVNFSDGTSLSSGSGIGVVAVAGSGNLKFVSSSSADANGKVNLANKGNYIIITDVDGDGQAGNIYLVTAGTNNATSSDDITITLLGTVMREGDSGDWATANISVA